QSRRKANITLELHVLFSRCMRRRGRRHNNTATRGQQGSPFRTRPEQVLQQKQQPEFRPATS
ncbi:MAG: hypothetical protein ACPIOQ_20925, partial [Promethearchaeia archaeon]